MGTINSKQEDILLKAFNDENKEKVLTLLKNTKKPAEIRDSDNWTLLHYAATYGWTDVSQQLVELYQVDPYVRSKSNGWTALHYACFHDCTDTVKYLVVHAHCDPFTEHNNGFTPFDYSAGETRHFLQDIIDKSKKQGSSSIAAYTNSMRKNHSVMKKDLAEGNTMTTRSASSVGLFVVAGADKRSTMKLLADQEPLHEHDSTVIKPEEYYKVIDEDTHASATKQLIAKGGHRPTADLSTKISSESPSVDHWEYGICIDFESNCLIESPHASNGFVASVQMYNHAASDSQASSPFIFPKEYHPVSAIYSISLPATSSSASVPFTLKIMHFVDPNSPEELEQLCFVMATNHSPTLFKVVKGGSFKVGESFGEIKLQHGSLWSIVSRTISRVCKGPSLYMGAVHYGLDSESFNCNCWTMQLIVTKYDCSRVFALNEYVRRNLGSPIKSSNKFLFKFTESKQLIAKISNYNNSDEHCVMCKNGWIITPDECRISQEFSDSFKTCWNEPGKCEFKIDTKRKRRCFRGNLPLIEMHGIESDTTKITIDLPSTEIATMNTMFQEDSTVRCLPRPLFKLSNLRPPTRNQVFNLLKCHSAHWYEIARELNVDFNDREELLMNTTLYRTAKMKLEYILQKWMVSKCSPVTWDNLIQVLKNLGYNYLINSIIRNMTTSPAQAQNRSTHRYHRKCCHGLINALLIFILVLFYCIMKKYEE